ncbi:PAS domain-containing protein, partial [Cohnella sp. REN36]|uniref:PAS domain-containing protein n=1 Tax=Cohnella sp. REN36 TaxID=2887347 RepID=UPI001D15DDB7
NQQILNTYQGTEKIYGVPAELFESNTDLWRQMIYPDDQDFVYEMEKLLEGGEAITREYRIIDSNGNIKWLHERIVP